MVTQTDRDPRHHTQKMQARLQETIDNLRADVEKVDEPQLKAIFETSAEVLGGLKKAFSDYEQKNSRAPRALRHTHRQTECLGPASEEA